MTSTLCTYIMLCLLCVPLHGCIPLNANVTAFPDAGHKPSGMFSLSTLFVDGISTANVLAATFRQGKGWRVVLYMSSSCPCTSIPCLFGAALSIGCTWTCQTHVAVVVITSVVVSQVYANSPVNLTALSSSLSLPPPSQTRFYRRAPPVSAVHSAAQRLLQRYGCKDFCTTVFCLTTVQSVCM